MNFFTQNVYFREKLVRSVTLYTQGELFTARRLQSDLKMANGLDVQC